MAKRRTRQITSLHHFRMGRIRPVARCPRFSLRNYLTRELPPPPASCDYSAKASTALSEMYLNNSLGDCVIAGIGHVVGVLTGNVGKQYTYDNAQIIKLYSAIGGYVPANRIPIMDATSRRR